jgi:hypothetical protein
MGCRRQLQLKDYFWGREGGIPPSQSSTQSQTKGPQLFSTAPLWGCYCCDTLGRPGGLALDDQVKPFGIHTNKYSVARWAYWRRGDEQVTIAALRDQKSPQPPQDTWTDRHTLALLSLMSSGPRFPAPGSTGSPTSSCHWPKAPRALFTRHFLTGERSKQWD